MVKITRFLAIITAACLLMAACAVEPPVITQNVNEKSASPTVASTEGKALVITPNVNEESVSPTVASSEVKVLVITRAMNGQSFSLKVGDTFEIQLATIPIVGFEWTPKDLDTTILFQEGQAVYTADSSPNSAGGIVTLRFKAVGAGKIHLTLLYLHPAENGVPSLYNNSFGVTIEVK